MSNILNSFGQHLRNLRLKKELSQEKLSELAKLHRTYISGLERGGRNPTLTTLIKIARALKITLSELVNFRDKNE